MKRVDDSEGAGAVRSEYDFSRAVKNSYAGRFAKGSNVVMIQPEIFAAFLSEEAVNQAFGLLIHDGARIASGPASARKKSV